MGSSYATDCNGSFSLKKKKIEIKKDGEQQQQAVLPCGVTDYS